MHRYVFALRLDRAFDSDRSVDAEARAFIVNVIV